MRTTMFRPSISNASVGNTRRSDGFPPLDAIASRVSRSGQAVLSTLQWSAPRARRAPWRRHAPNRLVRDADRSRLASSRRRAACVGRSPVRFLCSTQKPRRCRVSRLSLPRLLHSLRSAARRRQSDLQRRCGLGFQRRRFQVELLGRKQRRVFGEIGLGEDGRRQPTALFGFLSEVCGTSHARLLLIPAGARTSLSRRMPKSARR